MSRPTWIAARVESPFVGEVLQLGDRQTQLYLALPFYYRKYRPQEFNILRHAVLPVLGMIAVGVPMYYLVKPGQASPLDWFPYAALGVIAVSVAYAVWANRRDPGLGDRVGSIVADE